MRCARFVPRSAEVLPRDSFPTCRDCAANLLAGLATGACWLGRLELVHQRNSGANKQSGAR